MVKEYFSHDYNARNDSEMVKLLMKKGMAGIGIYWCIVEILYECNGELMRTECERIAFELRVEVEDIFEVIDNYNLFKKNDDIFWSESIKKRLKLREEKSEKARKSANSRWDDANAMRTQCDGNANKGKDKVKEKVNKDIPVFEIFKSYAVEQKPNICIDDLKLKYNAWLENDWKDGNDKQIKNWKTKLLNTIPYLKTTNIRPPTPEYLRRGFIEVDVPEPRRNKL